MKIIAFVVAKNISGDYAKLEKTIRTRMSSFLPDYMIPSDFVFLDKMPLTANVKVDTSALLNYFKIQTKGDYVPPKPDVEKMICKIWQEILSIESISVNDSFFLLGGDSIMAIQVVSKLRMLGFELQVKDIFAHQTIREISKFAKITSENSLSKNEYKFSRDLQETINSVIGGTNA